MGNPYIEMWTIYAAPADYPDVPYVVRGWLVGPGGALRETGALGFADTLAQARSIVPEGLTYFSRQEDDEPQIVETWL